MTKQKCIVVDIDGTVANHDGIRHHHAYDKVHLDEPHQDIINLVQILQFAQRQSEFDYDGFEILFVSGRPDSCEIQTIEWLNKYGIWSFPYTLHMRETGDYRPDFIVKKEIYDKHIEPFYDVWFALDDRDQIVNMWRENGIRCLQVREGNF